MSASFDDPSISPHAERADGAESRQKLLDTLLTLRSQGKHPTSTELAKVAGMSATNARHHLSWLEEHRMVTIREVPRRLIRREIMLVDENRP